MEEAELLADRHRLANSEQLATLAAEAALLLNGDDRQQGTAAVDNLMGVAAALGKLARIDPERADDYELAEGLAQQAQELALTLARYADEIEYDPQRLNELEERLELIRTLKRRHRVDSVDALLDFAERAATELAGIDQSDERLAQLRQREDELPAAYRRHQRALERGAGAKPGRPSVPKSCASWPTCAWNGRNSRYCWRKRSIRPAASSATGASSLTAPASTMSNSC